jgi:hypothetical protein
MMGESDNRGRIAYRFSSAAPEEQYVYGACSPGWHSAADQETCLDEWIRFMNSEGIERVCCLQAGCHLDSERANVSAYREAFGRNRVLHTPVPDQHLIDIDTLDDEILPFLAESAAAGEPVVVHSLAGVTRPGQVLAAWLVHGRGYESTEAVDTVIEMGRDPTAAVDAGNATRSELFELLGALGERGHDE